MSISYPTLAMKTDGTMAGVGGGSTDTTTSTNIGTSATAAITLGATLQNMTIQNNQLTFTGISGLTPTTTIASGGPAKCLGLPMIAVYALSAETTAIATSTTPATWWRIPLPWKIIGVRASLYTAGSTATTIDIRTVASGTAMPTSVAGGTSIFTTALTIASTKQSSCESGNTAYALTTAASTTGIADDSGFAVFITGAGTGSAGLKLNLYYTIY